MRQLSSRTTISHQTCQHAEGFCRCFQMPKQFDLAVDVGCGSGQGTILLAPYFTKVVGTDISPAQLKMAVANSIPPNVSYRWGGGEVCEKSSIWPGLQKCKVHGDVLCVIALWFDIYKFTFTPMSNTETVEFTVNATFFRPLRPQTVFSRRATVCLWWSRPCDSYDGGSLVRPPEVPPWSRQGAEARRLPGSPELLHGHGAGVWGRLQHAQRHL